MFSIIGSVYNSCGAIEAAARATYKICTHTHTIDTNIHTAKEEGERRSPEFAGLRGSVRGRARVQWVKIR